MALKAQKEAVEEHLLIPVWDLENLLELESLKNEPEFLRLVNIVKSDRAAQLKSVRAMEQSGELKASP